MNDAQIRLVQASLEQVRPISDQAAAMFYERLFTLDPSLRPLFRGDMQEQGRKLMQMLAAVVAGLSRLETILPAARDLGRRHVAYRVEQRHYATVGAALLGTLEAGLGEAFTPDVKEAWSTAYATLSAVMIAAAAEVSPGRASA